MEVAPVKMEAVEVDQRGLIDKILARYSSKYAVFRELLQNADDATASKVMIRFETASSVPSDSDSRPKFENVVRWVVKNNGAPFNDEDWDRLKVIANGNPNTLKIGTFGVGFYSVFAVTEEPCVKSGREQRKFGWAKDSKTKREVLFITRSPCAVDEEPWTTSFELPVGKNDLLSTQPLELGRFLVAALPFMSTIESISLYFDSTLLLHLSRTKVERQLSSPNDNLLFPQTSAFRTVINGIKITDVRIEVEGSPWLDKSEQTTSPKVRESKDLQLWSTLAEVQPNEVSRKELEKATKKRSIPKESKVQITLDLFTPQTGKEDLISKLTAGSKGHVYIGHATTQTTGFSGHVAGHFIPTVERELLDLENNHVKGWNEQLLYAAGCLARVIYDNEMESTKLSRDVDRFHRLLAYFTFDESNPHPRVSHLVRDAFFTSTSTDLLVLTPGGAFPAKDVRDYNEACKDFIKHLPMVEERTSMLARNMMGDRVSELLKPVTFEDLMEELRRRALTENEMISCLKWATTNNEIFGQCCKHRKMFLETASLSNTSRNLLKFSAILGSPPALFMTDEFPLPPTTLPRRIFDEVSNHAKLQELFDAKWLLVEEWLTHVCKEAAKKPSETMFVDVCKVLSDHWLAFPEGDKKSIKVVLEKFPCISTEWGLQTPKDAYLSDIIANTFPTLPFIKLEDWQVTNKEQMGTFLSFIGVRSRIELHILTTHTTERDNQALLHYFLVHDPTGAEEDSLKPMPLFVAHGSMDERRFKAAELYAPNKDVEELGLPVLSWKDAWSNESNEAKLLFKMGLRKYPDLLELLRMASGAALREKALGFLLKHFDDEYRESYLANYTKAPYADIPFIPVEGETELTTVSTVYTDRDCVSVGFLRVPTDFRINAERFKVEDQPSLSHILDRLRNSPPNASNAQKCFEYLLNRVLVLKEAGILNDLRDIPFVPVEEAGKHLHKIPTECYLASSTTLPHYRELFTYVELGTRANAFLKECGSQEIPSASEIANVLFSNPMTFYRALKYDKLQYMQELRRIAQNLDSDDQGQLKKTLERFKDSDIKPSLLGCDYSSYHCMEDKQSVEDEFAAEFLHPNQVVIMNDELNSSAFQDVPGLYYAPRVLEELYKALGSSNLSDCVTEHYRGTISVNEERQNHPVRHNIRGKVLGRLSMFLARYKDKERQERYREMNTDLVVNVYDHIEVIKVLGPSQKVIDSPWKGIDFPGKEIINHVKAGRYIAQGEDPDRYELWISETEGEKLDYFQMAYSVLGYLYETPTSNICCLFMTLLISTDEQLSQRGYRVPPSQSAEQRSIQDRELPRIDHLMFGRLSGRPGEYPPKIDVNAESDFEAPTSSIANKKGGWFRRTKKGRWFRRAKKPEPDDEQLEEMLRHAVCDYNESPSNTVSLRLEEQSSSCGRKCYRGTPQSMQDMNLNKSVTYAVWGGIDAEKDVLGEKRNDFVKLFKKFIDDVLDPLVGIYGVQKKRIRLLWDNSCTDLAAFTLDTNIYLNIGYFSIKHHGKMAHHDQLIAWFHLLAHEMAHRFYPEHDANFELFCSRIREKYIVKLFTLLPLERAVQALKMPEGGHDPSTLVPLSGVGFTAVMRNGLEI